jgi:hypothetical protein
MSRSVKLSRRALLGVGASLLLPRFLSAEREAHADESACEAPRRFLAYFTAHGWDMQRIMPATTGKLQALPPTLAPLGTLGVASDVLVVTGLRRDYLTRPDNGHMYPTAAFLTGHEASETTLDVRGPSLDQLIAKRLAGCALKRDSIQLGNRTATPGGDANVATYQSTMSWLHEGSLSTPLPSITDAKKLFDLLFGGEDPDATEAEIKKRLAYETSVIDYAKGDVDRLTRRLSRSDNARLDEYLTGLRELEKRLSAPALSCAAPAAPPSFDPTVSWQGIDADDAFLANHEALLDLAVLALRCDATRVITFMQAPSQGAIKYQFLDVNEDHHWLSHNGTIRDEAGNYANPDAQAQLARLEAWQVEQFGKIVQRLKAATDENERPLYDSTLAYLSSESGDGNGHSQRNVPVLLAGGAGGFKMGKHVYYRRPGCGEPNAPPDCTWFAYEGDRPMNRLFVSMLRAFGIGGAFGADGDKPLDGLVD